MQEYMRLELIALARREEKQAVMERILERKRQSPVVISTEEILAARDAGRR